MKDRELKIDRKRHVLYSKSCKRQIREKIALHYPPEKRNDVWERVQRQYADFLSDWHNGTTGGKSISQARFGATQVKNGLVSQKNCPSLES